MNDITGRMRYQGPTGYVAAFIIALVTFAAYSNCYRCEFLFDDMKDIVIEGNFHRLWPIWAPMFQIPPGTAASGRPMVGLSLAINYALGQTDPSGYHLFNVLIHFFSTLLLFGIVRRTLMAGYAGDRLAAGSAWIALAAALLWAAHPLQTESITYVIKRNESMMGMFYFLTLYLFIRGVQINRAVWLMGSVVACLMGMATKETMVTAPIMVYLYDRSFVESCWSRPIRKRGWYYAALLLTWIPLAYFVSGSPRTKVSGFGLAEFTSWEYLVTEFGVVLHYLRLSIWPDALCIDYFDWPVARSPAAVVVPALLIAVSIALSIWAVFRRPRAGYLAAWFFIVLSPSSSVVPIRELACEYRMYLPLAALAVAISCLAWSVMNRKAQTQPDAVDARPFAAVMVILVLAMGVRTYARNEDYRSPEVMWADVVAKRPDNYRARGNLAGYQAQRRDFAAAEVNHLAALRVKPDHFTSLLGMGNVCAQTGRPGDAARYFDAALRVEPNNAGAWANRGLLAASQGQYERAVSDLEAAAKMRPDLIVIRMNLAHAYEKLNRREEAVMLYRQILTEQPGNAAAQNALNQLRGH
jgi:tetratricopeptide (TPR) repeat protein